MHTRKKKKIRGSSLGHISCIVYALEITPTWRQQSGPLATDEVPAFRPCLKEEAETVHVSCRQCQHVLLTSVTYDAISCCRRSFCLTSPPLFQYPPPLNPPLITAVSNRRIKVARLPDHGGKAHMKTRHAVAVTIQHNDTLLPILPLVIHFLLYYTPSPNNKKSKIIEKPVPGVHLGIKPGSPKPSRVPNIMLTMTNTSYPIFVSFVE